MNTTLSVVLVLYATLATAAPEPQKVYVKDLRKHIDGTVAVKGIAGRRFPDAQAGIHVYTLVDDNNDVLYVHTREDYPFFNVTWELTGIPRIDPATKRVYLEETGRQRRLDPEEEERRRLEVERRRQDEERRRREEAQRRLAEQRRRKQDLVLKSLSGAAALLALVAVVVVIVLRRRTAGTALPPEWGYAEITSGPHQGRAVTLRAEEVLVGRGVDTTLHIDLPSDVSVSRHHGRLYREDGVPHYEDTGSSHGSWVNEQPVEPNQPVALPPGALLRLGPSTIIRVGPVEEIAGETQFAGSEAAGNWGEAETQRAEE